MNKASKEDIVKVLNDKAHFVPLKPDEIGHIPDIIAQVIMDNFEVYKKK